jgi:site-specific recombinase XerC
MRQLRGENSDSRYVFISECGGPAHDRRIPETIARTGEAVKLPFSVHPHMLQHSTSYKLANDGHDTRALQHYMGHKTSCTRFDTPKWRLIGAGIFGRTDNCSKTKPDLRVLRPGRDA